MVEPSNGIALGEHHQTREGFDACWFFYLGAETGMTAWLPTFLGAGERVLDRVGRGDTWIILGGHGGRTVGPWQCDR